MAYLTEQVDLLIEERKQPDLHAESFFDMFTL